MEKLVCGLAVWLHVHAGLSREVSNAVLQALSLIVNTVVTLIMAAMASQGVKVKIPPFEFPRDIRTAYKKFFPEPELKRTMCCPRCLSTFTCPIDDIPLTCPWRASPRSPACGADLWTKRQIQNGTKKVPSCLVTTQSVQSWLPSFLSRKVIDDALHETYLKQAVGINPEMRDIHDSPGWRNVYGPDRGPYDLVFGLYVDWFKVFKLKIAGEKHMSIEMGEN